MSDWVIDSSIPMPELNGEFLASDLPIGSIILFNGCEWEVKFRDFGKTVISRPGKVCVIWMLLPNDWPIIVGNK